ncbi:hypothetical protein RRG08_061180 [Elysia crispata]|uniref:Profilin n=1 Tax=Elysia crispata TaxID=231223 RepID=A0AAE1DJI0_9GAST|nr:hypothetical protein RRG08_061180 [Elysia crispata]
MSSWDTYVDNLEKGLGQCKYVAILGKSGDSPLSIWAESPDKSSLNPSHAELLSVAASVMKEDNSLMGTGLQLGGVKFACIRSEPGVLICQGKYENKDYSLVFASTGNCLLIGFNPQAEVKTTKVREAVEVMKNYLKEAGY